MAEETFENIEEVRATDGSEKTVGIENLKVLENIDVELTVEVGRTEITIRDLLRLNEGSVVELDRLAGVQRVSARQQVPQREVERFMLGHRPDVTQFARPLLVVRLAQLVEPCAVRLLRVVGGQSVLEWPILVFVQNGDQFLRP